MFIEPEKPVAADKTGRRRLFVWPMSIYMLKAGEKHRILPKTVA
jgi:hypothetical protein